MEFRLFLGGCHCFSILYWFICKWEIRVIAKKVDAPALLVHVAEEEGPAAHEDEEEEEQQDGGNWLSPQGGVTQLNTKQWQN